MAVALGRFRIRSVAEAQAVGDAAVMNRLQFGQRFAQPAGGIVSERGMRAVGSGIEYADDDAATVLADTGRRAGSVPDRVRTDVRRPPIGIEMFDARRTKGLHAGDCGDPVGFGSAQVRRNAIQRDRIVVGHGEIATQRELDIRDMCGALRSEKTLVGLRGGRMHVELAVAGGGRRCRLDAAYRSAVIQQTGFFESDDVGTVYPGLADLLDWGTLQRGCLGRT